MDGNTVGHGRSTVAHSSPRRDPSNGCLLLLFSVCLLFCLRGKSQGLVDGLTRPMMRPIFCVLADVLLPIFSAFSLTAAVAGQRVRVSETTTGCVLVCVSCV